MGDELQLLDPNTIYSLAGASGAIGIGVRALSDAFSMEIKRYWMLVAAAVLSFAGVFVDASPEGSAITALLCSLANTFIIYLAARGLADSTARPAPSPAMGTGVYISRWNGIKKSLSEQS